MQYNQSISLPFDNLYRTNLGDQPAASSIPVFLTASALLFAVDATIHLFRWRPQEEPQIQAVVTTINPTTGPLRQIVVKAEEILEDFRELEMQLASKDVEQLSIKPRGALHSSRRVRRRLMAYSDKDDNCQMLASDNDPSKDRTSKAFDSFCEHLLLMNRVWRQEREIKELRSSLEAKKKATTSTAFRSFCDQLLLWNRIWKLEKAVKSLVAEGERMKRSRVMAITRAAKQMVLDVQKERLVEEFVKDLIGEVEESKRDMKSLRKAHEREIEEMNGDWVKDYRVVVKELNALKLAQEARLLQQEITNDEEDSLYENLIAGRRRVEELEKKIAEYEHLDYASSSDDTVVGIAPRIYGSATEHDDERTDVELDVISETSTSSTCVSVGRDTSRTKKLIPSHGAQRRRCVSLRSTHESHNAAGKLSTYDRAQSVSALKSNISAATRTCNHSGQPMAFRNRTMSSVSLKTPSSGTRDQPSGGLMNRAPWR